MYSQRQPCTHSVKEGGGIFGCGEDSKRSMKEVGWLRRVWLFPVVILGDFAANLTSPQGCCRYIVPDRHLCAQGLLRCGPWEPSRRARPKHWLTRKRRCQWLMSRRRDRGILPAQETWRTSDLAMGCPRFGVQRSRAGAGTIWGDFGQAGAVLFQSGAAASDLVRTGDACAKRCRIFRHKTSMCSPEQRIRPLRIAAV